MPRYEDGKHFFHVAVTGATVTVTSGRLGNKGRTTAKSLASPAAAKAHLDVLVAERLREGFALVAESDPPPAPPDATADARLDELEERIAEEPDDIATWQVYGDLLQRRGDPRGELGALMRAAELERAGNRTKTAQLAVAKYFAQHVGALLGPLAKHVRDVRDPWSPPLVWRNGFIHRAELTDVALLDEILAHPSGRLLGELALKARTREDVDRMIDALGRREARLVGLDLVVRAERVELGRLWPHVPRLRRLSVMARSFHLGELDLEELRQARLLAYGLPARALAAVVAAHWPHLERLELRFGFHPQVPDAATFEDLEPLLARTDLPALVQLKLRGAPFAGAIARAIAAGPLAAQLEILDLSHGTVTPRDIEVLAESKHRFAKLRELWLPAAAMWGNGPKLLAGIAKHVISDQRAPLDTLEGEVA